MLDFNKAIPTPLSERLKSPFFGSFVISWLICNWKILFVICFPDRYDLDNQNLAEYIANHYMNWWLCIILPLICSIAYILILPKIEYYVSWYRGHEKGRRYDKLKEVSKEHFIPGNMYYDLQMKLEKEREKVIYFDREIKSAQATALEKENETSKAKNELEEATKRNEILYKEKNEAVENYAILSSRHIISRVFYGRWKLVYTGPSSAGEEYFEIVGEDVYQIIQQNGTYDRFKIKCFDFDPIQKKLSFVKYLIKLQPGEAHCINELRMISSQMFEGIENDIVKVVYTKV